MKRSGFTLIELLVVITIIGILIAMLLPAVNGIRASGRRTQCLSNLRNVGIAYQAYYTKHGQTPAAGGWTTFLLPLMENNREVLICPSDIEYLEEGGTGAPEIFPDQGIDAIYHVRNRTFAEYGGSHNIPFDPSGPRCRISQSQTAPEGGAAYDFEDATDFDWTDMQLICEPMENGDIKITAKLRGAGYTFDIFKGDGSLAEGEAEDYKPPKVCYVPAGAVYTSYGCNNRSAMMTSDSSRIIFLDYHKKVAEVVGPDAADIWEEQVAPRHRGLINVCYHDGHTGTVEPSDVTPVDVELHDTLWRPFNDRESWLQ